MSDRVACFVLERTESSRRWLRRYASGEGRCNGFCNGMTLLGDYVTLRGPGGDEVPVPRHSYPDDDPQWPLKCDRCGSPFMAEEPRQVFTLHLYRVVAVMPGALAAVGDVFTLRDVPAGAMWNADWFGSWAQGPDGRSLVVKLPNQGEWLVDGPASNCTKPDEKTHRCWIRHGEWPAVTVDKSGNTCEAGAGSIASGDYHGFLRGGYLERC